MNKKKIHHKYIYYIGLIISVCILILLFIQQYLSVDARYARDNANYMLSRRGYTQNASMRPMVLNLEYLFIASTEEAKAYFESLTDETKEVSDSYDILSRLWLKANSDDVQNVYDGLQFLAAITNPEHTSTTISYIATNKGRVFDYEALNIAVQTLEQMQTEFYLLFTGAAAMLVMMVIGIAKSFGPPHIH